MSVAPPVDPVDSSGTREVRVSEYVDRVLRRWYVVAATIVVAVLLVVLRGASTAHTVEGTATVYLGQAVTPGGGAVFPYSPGGSLATAQSVANSQATLAVAARAAGVSVDSIRGNVAVHQTAATAATTKVAGGPVTVQVIVQGSWSTPRTAATIVGVLAVAVQHAANSYQTAKLGAATKAITAEQSQIAGLQQSVTINNALITRLTGAGSSQALALVAALNQRTSDTQLLSTLQTQLQDNQTSVASIKNVEAAQILTPAAARTVTATTRHSSFVIAAFIGLIVGCLIALAWEAVRRQGRHLR